MRDTIVQTEPVHQDVREEVHEHPEYSVLYFCVQDLEK